MQPTAVIDTHTGLGFADELARVLALLPGNRPEMRYLVCLGGMAAMMVAPAITLVVLWLKATAGSMPTLPIVAADGDVWARLTPVLPGVTLV